MVWLGPLSPIDGDGRPVIPVPNECTAEDRDWLRAMAELAGRGIQEWPTVDIEPDPALLEMVWR